jgi:hypothetical protein
MCQHPDHADHDTDRDQGKRPDHRGDSSRSISATSVARTERLVWRWSPNDLIVSEPASIAATTRTGS